MLNVEAFYKISYGLYIVSSGDKNSGGGFISNSVFQVTAQPPKFAACCNKDNFTAEIIKKHQAFAISVLHQDSKSDIIGRFGFKSGRNFDKLEGMNCRYGQTGIPIVLNEAIATIECKLVQTFDVGTHLMFIGEAIDTEVLSDELQPLTYDYYKKVKKGIAPKNAPTYIDKSQIPEKKESIYKKYKCPACGYIYDEELGDVDNGIKAGTRFEDLPPDWICPVCGSTKDDFYEI